MRKKLAGVLAAVVAVSTAAVAIVALNAGGAQAAASEPYTWKNVRIDGGGFVPGIIFNQTEPNLIYARTDIGGAYRWDQAATKWTPLLDWVGWSNWGWNGVVSLATDPVQTNRVYAAVGMYLNEWDPNNGAILRSTDKGATWTATTLPFKVGGNMPGRAQGERLAVDPNNNAIVYFGAEAGNGLWKSTNFGVTWAKVTNFPNVGNYVAVPGDIYQGFNQGVTWVSFDKSTGTAGNTTQAIYVGVADKQNTVYRSVNGGTTWERIAGQPTGFLAHKGVIDPVGRTLYITTSDTGGPYDGAKGDVWKYNITTGAWTQISPVLSSSADDYFGYSGLTIDRLHPNTIMVATQISWWPDAIFFRSTDAGATWTRIWDFTSYPNRSFRYTQSVASVPWLTFGTNPAPPEVSPKLGWMNASVEIDPFNSNRLMYGTGATIYGTNNLTAWDTGGQIAITPMVAGLEETAVLDLISPPTGAPLISGLGDVAGFRHTNLDAVPAMMFTQPSFTSTTSLDYAETNPSVMVRSGNFTDADRPNDSHVAFSTDGGGNWFQGTEPGGINSGGTVAASADGSRFVWAPGDAGQPVVFSVGFGGSWTQATGVPANSIVESDRVNSQKFYAYSAGRFYVSTNGGAAFTQTAATGLPTAGTVHFKALPGVDGDVWLAGGDVATSVSGLWHSTNSGASFTKVANVTEAVNVGFGKAAPGQTYQALFLMGTVDGVKGVYRSDNASTTWVRINDNAHQYGNAGEALTGDPRVYGRVYLGTNGRGILYADRQGTATPPPPDTTAPSTPGTPTASAITASGATLSWTASTDNVGVTGYDVINASNTVIASSTTNSVTLTGLTASTQYVLRVRAKDAAGNLSTASAAVTFTTSAATGDTTVPSTPGTPTASAITATGATLSWTASTDNVGVAGYNIYRRVGTTDTQLTTSTTNSATLTGLTAATAYTIVVRARDAAGNLSATSGAVTFTTSTAGGGGGCSAAYTITNSWGGGFQGSVAVTNTGTTATTAWTVTWTFANGQSISQIWGGLLTASGSSVTVRNESYNGALAANAGTTFGFIASWNGTNAIPTVTCSRTP
jgi:chitodextrinase